jgi:hypothetical protein
MNSINSVELVSYPATTAVASLNTDGSPKLSFVIPSLTAGHEKPSIIMKIIETQPLG